MPEPGPHYRAPITTADVAIYLALNGTSERPLPSSNRSSVLLVLVAAFLAGGSAEQLPRAKAGIVPCLRRKSSSPGSQRSRADRVPGDNRARRPRNCRRGFADAARACAHRGPPYGTAVEPRVVVFVFTGRKLEMTHVDEDRLAIAAALLLGVASAAQAASDNQSDPSRGFPYGPEGQRVGGKAVNKADHLSTRPGSVYP